MIFFLSAAALSIVSSGKKISETFINHELNQIAESAIIISQDASKASASLDLGFSGISHIEEAFVDIVKNRGEFLYVALLGSQQEIVSFASRSGITKERIQADLSTYQKLVPNPHVKLFKSYIAYDESKMGSIVVGIDQNILQEAVWWIGIDSIIGAITMTLLVVTTLRFAMSSGTLFKNNLLVQVGVKKFGTQLPLMQLAIFLVALSEEIIRPFLSLYLESNFRLQPDISTGALVAMGLASFSLSYALMQIIGPVVSRQISSSSLLSAGIAFMFVGSGLFLFSHAWPLVILARALSGLGFGLILISSQLFLLTNSGHDGNIFAGIRNIAASMVIAGLCGPLIGAMIAQNTSYQAAIAFATLIIFLASIVWSIECRKQITNKPIPSQLPRPNNSAQVFWSKTLFSRNILWLLLGFPVPIKAVAAAILIFVVPKALIDSGYDLIMVGRVLSIYFFSYLVTQYALGRTQPKFNAKLSLIVTSLISAISCYLCLEPTLHRICAAMFCLGLAHALSNTKQLELLLILRDQSQSKGVNNQSNESLVGLYRLSERIGAALGPGAGVLIASRFDLYTAGLALFAISIIGVLLIVGLISHLSPREE